MQAVDEALAALHSGDILGRGNSVTKAVEIISELRLSLRREVHPAYCDTLGELYSYMQRQLFARTPRNPRAYSKKFAGCFRPSCRAGLARWRTVNARPPESIAAEAPSGESVRPVSSSVPYEPMETPAQNAVGSSKNVCALRAAVTTFAIPKSPREAKACANPCSAISSVISPV